MPVLQLDAESGVGEQFGNDTGKFEQFFFSHLFLQVLGSRS
jgi:hypothetical protein